MIGILLGSYTYEWVEAGIWLVGAAGMIGIACLDGLLRKVPVRKKTQEKADPLAIVKDRSYRRKKNLFLAAMLTLLSGAALSGMQLQSTAVVWPQVEKTWQAKVEDRNKLYEDGVQATVSIAEGIYKGCRVRIHLKGTDTTRLTPGLNVKLHTTIRTPQNTGNPDEFDYRFYLLTHGISGVGYCDSTQWEIQPHEGSIPSLSLKDRIRSYRYSMEETYRHYFHGEIYALLSAMTLGDKTFIQPEVRQLFSETGASHVLALSGLHLGILFGLFLWVIRRWGQKRPIICLLTILALFSLWTYVIVCGESQSLVRAATMFSMMLTAQCIQNRMKGLQNITVCSLILLAASPLSLYDVGFQLSVAAVCGISLFNEYFRKKFPILNPNSFSYQPLPKRSSCFNFIGWMCALARSLCRKTRQALSKWAVELFVLSASAQLATAPFVLYYFHVYSPIALVSNFFVIPLTTMALLLSVLFFVLPFLQGIVAPVLSWTLATLLNGLQAFAAIPGVCWHLYPSLPTILFATCSVAFLLCFFALRDHRKLLWSAVALSVCCASVLIDNRPNRVKPHIEVYQTGRVTNIHFVTSARRSYLLSSVSKDSATHSLRYVRDTYWAKNKWADPHYLPYQWQNEEIRRRNDVVTFGQMTMVWLHRQISTSYNPQHAKSIGLLVISRGCWNTPEEILSYYHPTHIVLDVTLPQKQRQRLRDVFRQYGLQVYDKVAHIELLEN